VVPKLPPEVKAYAYQLNPLLKQQVEQLKADGDEITPERQTGAVCGNPHKQEMRKLAKLLAEVRGTVF